MMATAGDDRRWVIEQFEYLYDRKPTQAELDWVVGWLQAGNDRQRWMQIAEQQGAREAVVRLYKQVLGRDPTDAEVAAAVARIEGGSLTRKALQQTLAESSEALLREPEDPDDPGAEDALAYLIRLLADYGLEGMGEWAWQQIQEGYTDERVLQNLRETDQYKQRFAGMERRRAAGLSAISEGEYIAYEREVRQMMRAAGMPADFYDQPDDFAAFIGNDLSPAEMQARINDGYLAASQADPSVRAQLRDLYGLDEGALAAFFLDPDRALPIIQRQYQASEVSAAGVRVGYGSLTRDEAEHLAGLGVTGQQAQQGLGALAERSELFQGLPGEQEGLLTRQEGLAAAFEGDTQARQRLERKGAERVSAGSGAQSFAMGQGGAGGLSRR